MGPGAGNRGGASSRATTGSLLRPPALLLLLGQLGEGGLARGLHTTPPRLRVPSGQEEEGYESISHRDNDGHSPGPHRPEWRGSPSLVLPCVLTHLSPGLSGAHRALCSLAHGHSLHQCPSPHRQNHSPVPWHWWPPGHWVTTVCLHFRIGQALRSCPPIISQTRKLRPRREGDILCAPCWS